MTAAITVQKLDHRGKLKFEYSGEVLERSKTHVCLRAVFDPEKVDLGFVTFVRGDIFTEWFYAFRWYNVFQVNSGVDGQLKGWYCNITRPAVITQTTVAADDLALDAFVMPDGYIHVLDEDEFARLRLSEAERAAALDALEMIYRIVASRKKPFDIIAK